MKHLFVIIFSLVLSSNAVAFEVKSNTFVGQKTKIAQPITVVLPDNYSTNKRYNVIYVLHGFSGNHTDWTKLTNIAQLADQYDVIVVNPDGNYGAWYLNSPVLNDSQYETYIAEDVVNYIDNTYSTNRSKMGRGITGLSMGGYGALNVAINNQQVFAAVTSMSGGVDLRPFAAEFGIAKVLGEYSQYPQRWDNAAIINNLHKLAAGNTQWKKTADSLAIMLDIGVEDFFIEQNRELHQALLSQRIRHDYVERPGAHDWHYWQKVIPYQFLFLTSHMLPAAE